MGQDRVGVFQFTNKEHTHIKKCKKKKIRENAGTFYVLGFYMNVIQIKAGRQRF